MSGFPNPVNEKAARVVAGVVAVLGIVVLATCQVFALLMRVGLVPEETCERCANIWATMPEADPARP